LLLVIATSPPFVSIAMYRFIPRRNNTTRAKRDERKDANEHGTKVMRVGIHMRHAKKV
jgi:hypothetical protein